MGDRVYFFGSRAKEWKDGKTALYVGNCENKF